MNKREFICRAVIAISNEGVTATLQRADALWKCAETLWDARPQWMKEEDSFQEKLKNFTLMHSPILLTGGEKKQ